jgi:hypothetical protein
MKKIKNITPMKQNMINIVLKWKGLYGKGCLVLGRDEMTLQVPLTGKVNLAKLTPETQQKCKECALILAQVTSLKGQ